MITNTGDVDASDDLTVTSIAGGDLSGSILNPTVIGLQGQPISSFSPFIGQALVFDGSQWAPGSASNWNVINNNLLEFNGAINVEDSLRVNTNLQQERFLAGVDGNGHGYLYIRDNTGAIKAGLRINGSGQGEVYGDFKNFRMEHPTNPEKEIWYASLEGPEAAAYLRGTSKLEDGQAAITFPEHFQLLANAEGMTVLLTPLSGESKGLAVIEKTERGFQVVELLGGTGNYEFDWEVKCIRKGYENFEVIRPKTDIEP